MIASATVSFFAHPLTQDTAQTAPGVFVDGSEDRAFTVLEVLEPAAQAFIEIRADGLQTTALAATGLFPDCVLQFIHAFLSRPFHVPLKMVTQEVEASGLTGIDQSGFVRVQD